MFELWPYRRPQSAREIADVTSNVTCPHLPAAGEIVIFDRSWYNRAGVDAASWDFVPKVQAQHFLKAVPPVEKAIVDSGNHPASNTGWKSVQKEQTAAAGVAHRRRPKKIWKLSPMDLKSYSRWFDYSRARDEMFAATDKFMGAVVCCPL